MSNRIIYISRSCPHCRKLLIGIHRYDFLKHQFTIIDISTNKYPNYIDSVPTLVIGNQMIKNDDVFGYMNNLVQQIFEKNPQLKQKYHPDKPQQNQNQNQNQNQGNIGQAPKDLQTSSPDKIDELIGWCPDGGCMYSEITDKNDDCSKQNVSLNDDRYSFISDDNSVNGLSDNLVKIPMEQDNKDYQKSEKQQKMDQSYERLMNERKLLNA